MANLYLSDAITGLAPGDTVAIEGADARHAVAVNRIVVGERVAVGNGRGTIGHGTAVAVSPALLSVELADVNVVRRPSPAICLVQALAKGDRDELAIQAATELGVDGVIPWAAARSISRWEGARVGKGHERWSAIVREAAKQSARAWVPDVGPLVSTKQLAALADTAHLIVLDPLSEFPLTALPIEELASDGRYIVVVVGPEGGISSSELDILYNAGAVGVRLGATILRTSTAGPAAIAVLNAKLGRW